MKEKEYLTIKEAADHFDRSVGTIRNYIRSGILIIHDIDPRDNVTHRLKRREAEVI